MLVVCKASLAQTNPSQGDKAVSTNVTVPATRDTTHSRIITRCTPSRAEMLARPALIVVFSGGREIQRGKLSDSTLTGNINPKSIRSVNILQDTAGVKKYGNDARFGVVEVYLKDEKHPKKGK
jgi:hypothetical protein